MKILVVHNNYRSNLIGGEDLVFKREFDALVELLGKDNVFRYEEFNDNATVMSLIKNMLFSRKHKKNIFDLVKKHNIDIVHIHNFFPLLSTSIFQGAKQAGAKVVHTLHNYRWWCIGGVLYRDGIGICEKCIQKKFDFSGVNYGCYRNSKIQSFLAALAFYNFKRINSFKYIDCFFVLTEFQQQKLIEFNIPKGKILIKPNFNTHSENILIDYNNKSDFVFVGRLEEAKGIVNLIKSWKKIDKKLTIIGDGPLRNYINENTSENIQYLGNLDNDEVKKILMQSKYLIQLSKWYETFGLTIIEAFQMGTPVIGLDIGTRKNFIVDGYNGFLLNNVDELKSTIDKADQYEFYEKLVENALDTAKEYSKDKIIKLQMSIYEKIIKGESN